MHADISVDTLQPLSRIDQFSDLAAPIIGPLKVRIDLHRLIYSHSDRQRWNHFTYPVNFRQVHSQYAPAVSNGGAGLHGTKCSDLADMVAAVFIADILNKFFSAVVLNVQIDIRHLDAFGIEEPFKGKAIFNWVDIRNA